MTDIDANVIIKIVHPEWGERVIYSGSFKNIPKSGIFEKEQYITSLNKCIFLIQGVSEETRNKMIEKMKFEASLNDDIKMKSWKDSD